MMTSYIKGVARCIFTPATASALVCDTYTPQVNTIYQACYYT